MKTITPVATQFGMALHKAKNVRNESEVLYFCIEAAIKGKLLNMVNLKPARQNLLIRLYKKMLGKTAQDPFKNFYIANTPDRLDGRLSQVDRKLIKLLRQSDEYRVTTSIGSAIFKAGERVRPSK